MSYLETMREKSKTVLYKEGDNSFPSHFHKNLEFLYVLDQPVKVVLNGEELTVPKGHLLLIDSFDVHHILGKSPTITLGFPVEYLDDFFSVKKDQTFAQKILPDDDGSLEREIRPFERFDNDDFLIRKGKVDCFLGKLVARSGLCKWEQSKTDELVRRTVLFLNDNFHSPLSLESVAQGVGYSKFTLSHNFKKKTGMELREYLTELRLNDFISAVNADRARGEMKKLIEYAMNAGFESVQTFYRVFQNRFHTTPKAYMQGKP